MSAQVQVSWACEGAVPEPVPLMVDTNGACDSRTAVAPGRSLGRLKVAGFDEPPQRYDLERYLEVRHVLDLPITAGEHLATLDGILSLVSRRAVDIVQPDVANCAGPGSGLPHRRPSVGDPGGVARRDHAAVHAGDGHPDRSGPGAALRVRLHPAPDSRGDAA